MPANPNPPVDLNLAVVPGDGTGQEVIAQGMRCLDALAKSHGFSFAPTTFPFGGDRYLQTGDVLTDDEVDTLRGYDAIYLGALGHPDVKPGVLEKGILLKLRFDLDQYINLRPVKLYEGIETPLAGKRPADIDMLVIRENTEDLYCGNGGIARKNTPQEISTQEMIATRFGVERCVRFAFDQARARAKARQAAGASGGGGSGASGGGKLTLIHKTNVLTHCGDTWMRTFTEVGEADYPDVEREYHHVDACCMYLVASPERYDTLVVPNMFGDIITDLGAAIAGGMGIAASGNLNPGAREGARGQGTGDSDGNSTGSDTVHSPRATGPFGPSMFEPVHGSSPDIAGQNKANPLAAIDSLALLLTQTGMLKASGAHESGTKLIAAGDKLNKAVMAVTPRFTGKRLDRSGYACDQIGDMVLDALE